MSAPAELTASTATDDAYDAGWRMGLASAALALSVVAFFNLVGLEKSVLALVLAVISVRGAPAAFAARRRGTPAIWIGAVHIATIIVGLVLMRGKLWHLIQLLHQLN